MPQSIRRILVAVKDPQAAECVAARKAAQLALGLHAELCLYHGLTDPLYVDVPSLTEESIARTKESLRAATTEQLERLAAPLRKTGITVTTDVNCDYPSQEAIVRAAQRMQADLVVVDCPRPTHPATWLFHFTDWELLRTCPLPILVVKSHALYTRASVLAAVDPEKAAGKPATLDLDILAYGSALASAVDSNLHAVHAFNPLAVSVSQRVIPQLYAEVEQQAYSTAQEAMNQLLNPMEMEFRCRHVEEGFAIDVIESVLARTGAQILVLGSISRSGLKRITIGNTAERMLDRVVCDLLVVKPPGFLNAIPPVCRSPQIVARDTLEAAMRAAS
jgi:universal stress protein E